MSTDLRGFDANMLAHLQTWIGKSESRDDYISAAPFQALSVTLDHDDVSTVPKLPLPALWHWLYFLPISRQSEIGPDGHARRGGFLPPALLPRRMWAGSRLDWQPLNRLVVGDSVKRISTIVSITHKAGRTGSLLFVLLKHEIHNQGGLALIEEHDIVYRAAAHATDQIPTPLASEQGAAWQREVIPDPVLLFRYSALTFNGHRIHYDRQYATEVEGYPGLVVHGPLIATLLIDLVQRHIVGVLINRFEFRAIRPTFDRSPFRLNAQPSKDGRSVRVWAEDQEGWLTMHGTVQLT